MKDVPRSWSRREGGNGVSLYWYRNIEMLLFYADFQSLLRGSIQDENEVSRTTCSKRQEIRGRMSKIQGTKGKKINSESSRLLATLLESVDRDLIRRRRTIQCRVLSEESDRLEEKRDVLSRHDREILYPTRVSA